MNFLKNISSKKLIPVVLLIFVMALTLIIFQNCSPIRITEVLRENADFHPFADPKTENEPEQTLPPYEEVDGDWCVPYVESLSEDHRNQLLDYLASDEYGFEAKYGRPVGRGFEVVEKTFTEQTGRTLGVSNGGSVGPPQYPVLPGWIKDNQYLALSFSMPHLSAFSLGFTRQNGVKISEHFIIAAISPCKGDFRPQHYLTEDPTAEPYTFNWCRTIYEREFMQLNGGNTGLSPYECPTPANKTMYLNITLRDLYQPGDITQIPEDFCQAEIREVYCGSHTTISIPTYLNAPHHP